MGMYNLAILHKIQNPHGHECAHSDKKTDLKLNYIHFMHFSYYLRVYSKSMVPYT